MFVIWHVVRPVLIVAAKLSQAAGNCVMWTYNGNALIEGMMGRLTTHILDTANGKPAGNVDLRLYAVGEQRNLVASAVTNVDGRTQASLLEDDAMQAGIYELEFDVGSYFSAQGNAMSDPPFLDTVVIRFSVRADEHYHVPLLVSPWSYSTYRGS
jgi:5-hydroxyisourate hydrolase